MKIGIIIAVIFIVLVFVSSCEISDYLGFDLDNLTEDLEENKNNEELNNLPVIEDIKLKK